MSQGGIGTYNNKAEEFATHIKAGMEIDVEWEAIQTNATGGALI